MFHVEHATSSTRLKEPGDCSTWNTRKPLPRHFGRFTWNIPTPDLGRSPPVCSYGRGRVTPISLTTLNGLLSLATTVGNMPMSPEF
jgi:hypothetical protein